MSLKERIFADVANIFINPEHFADTHTWNGVAFMCVADEEMALKRKNNNVVDMSWDNNSAEVVLYVEKGVFPGHTMPNEHGFFDNKPMKILSVNEDMGMLAIALVAFDPKAVNY